MNVVAMDTSTPRLSLAWLADGCVVAEREAVVGRGLSVELLSHLEGLRSDAGGSWDAVDAWVVGRGPGGYTGLRAGFAAAIGLALPGGTPIWATDSGDGIAWAMRPFPEAGLAVIGDARRDACWLGCYRTGSDADDPSLDAPGWRLVPWADLAAELPDGCRVTSPEWDRVAPRLAGQEHRLHLDGRDRMPRASALARAALVRQRQGQAFAAPVPLYLHPAVG